MRLRLGHIEPHVHRKYESLTSTIPYFSLSHIIDIPLSTPHKTLSLYLPTPIVFPSIRKFDLQEKP